MIDMQALVDAMGSASRITRSQYQMTLGAAIQKIATFPKSFVVTIDTSNFSPGPEDSYRGYYSDLAFEPNNGSPKTVDEFSHQLGASLDKEYTGYKGGEYVMDAGTPLWISSYGSADNFAVMDMILENDRVVLVTKQLD